MTKEEKEQSIKEKMNAIYTSSTGVQCRIVNYRNFHDVDVQFLRDGKIREHLDYRNLQTGQFSHPDDLPNANNRIGQQRTNKNGVAATVIEYISAQDFTIQLPDGSTKHLSTWKDFNEGNFSEMYVDNYKISNFEKEKRKQDIIKNTSGYSMKILNYRTNSDIDVIFEDDTIVKNKTYYNFKNGNIVHPKYKTLKAEKLNIIKQHGIKDVLRYNNKKDFDIELEDGTIVYNANYYRCTSGDLAKLHAELNLTEDEINKRTTTYITKNKHTAHIKKWHTCLNIDIEFEDGEEVKGITWNQFIKKQFFYPSEANIKNQALKYIYKNYKHGAKQRGISFNITKDDVFELIHKPCYLCGRSNLNELKIANSTYKYNGIDRINNNIGYQKDNILPCCKDCNRAKSTMDLESFTNWINLIQTNLLDKRAG